MKNHLHASLQILSIFPPNDWIVPTELEEKKNQVELGIANLGQIIIDENEDLVLFKLKKLS